MILGIDHVQVTVPRAGEAEARKFYIDFLGLREIEKPDNRKGKGGFWVQVGTGQLHVSIEEDIDRLKTRAHVAYAVNNLDEWRKKFIQQGIKFTESAPFPKAEAFEFRDPFGNRIEIIENRI